MPRKEESRGKESGHRGQGSKRADGDSRHREKDLEHRRKDKSRDGDSTHSPIKPSMPSIRSVDRRGTDRVDGPIPPPKRSETVLISRNPTAPSIPHVKRAGTASVSRDDNRTHQSSDAQKLLKYDGLAKSIPALKKAYAAHNQAIINADQDELLASLKDQEMEVQIVTLGKILELFPQGTFLKLEDKLACCRQTKAMKDAYEKWGKINHELRTSKGTDVKMELAAMEKANSTKEADVKKKKYLAKKNAFEKEATIQKQDAFDELREILRKAAYNQPELVLSYVSLMRLDYLYCPSAYIIARTHAWDKFCRHDIRYLNRCLLALPEGLYVHRQRNSDGEKNYENQCRMNDDEEIDKEKDDRIIIQDERDHETWKSPSNYVDMMEEAAKNLPSTTRDREGLEAMDAIDNLKEIGLLWEARKLCAISLRLYRKPEFERKLIKWMGKATDVQIAKTLLEARPDSKTYRHRFIDIVAKCETHDAAKDAAWACASLLLKYPSLKDILEALRKCLRRVHEKDKHIAIDIWSDLIWEHPSKGFHRYLNKVLISLDDDKLSWKIWYKITKNPAGDEVSELLCDRYDELIELGSAWDITCPLCMKGPLISKCKHCKHMYCDACARKLIERKENCYGCDSKFSQSSRSDGGYDRQAWLKTCMNLNSDALQPLIDEMVKKRKRRGQVNKR
ncbi:hypothetical protein ACMFMG_010492 [Clarireedia jacksonii]